MAVRNGKGAKASKSAERRERLAAALRENLKRRKAGARAPAGHAAQGPNESDGLARDLPAARQNNAVKPG